MIGDLRPAWWLVPPLPEPRMMAKYAFSITKDFISITGKIKPIQHTSAALQATKLLSSLRYY